MPRFRHETYEPRFSGTIASLMQAPAQAKARALRESGNIQAQRAANSGQIWGNAAGNIGQIAAGGIQQYGEQQQAQQAKEREAQIGAVLSEVLAGRQSPEALVKVAGPESGMKMLNGLKAWQELESGQVKDAQTTVSNLAAGLLEVPQETRAQLWPQVQQAAIKAKLFPEEQIQGFEPTDENLRMLVKGSGGTLPAPEKPQGFTLGPGQQRFGPDGQPLASVEAKPEKVTFGQPQIQIVDGKRALIRAGSDGQIYDTKGQPIPPEKIQPLPEATGTAASEPLVPVMGDDGRPVLMRRSQAEGRRPASVREQGRPVTSGDAGRIAELDTSLDDLNVLAQTVLPVNPGTGELDNFKTTGAQAQASAMLPNWATELTGWGEDAKSRQAVIDRVKQVIGKALEGGVLRKEDEYKYTKILPTIGDVPEVVKTKLEGLQKAISLRRERQIDALEDAGYDVANFRARAPKSEAAPAAVKTALESVQAGRHTLSDGSVWDKLPDGSIRKVK